MAQPTVVPLPTPVDPLEDAYESLGETNGPCEPLAIIGMGCRLPGGVNSATRLWDLLKEGKDGRCDIPQDRFNVDAFYHPQGLTRPGSVTTRGGYFIKEDTRLFDPEFFNISPAEAIYMDPQQRKLLEVVYEAFESAGATLSSVSGGNIGCYVGNFTFDYSIIQSRDAEYLHRYSATGMGPTILANRISYIFNLKGPSLVIDTACSSSLYCLHAACVALQSRECDAAVVAGANLVQSVEQHLGTLKAGVLSSTSTCHSFSAEADGYGRADGVGCLYVKRLADAIRDNDPVRGVIRGTAVNANGKTAGITLPSALGQEAVVRKAYSKAGLDLDQTTYVECHGTGTPVGDPIEVEGLSRVFHRSNENPLLIGSVKTNLGHSEAASGLSGVMKTILALEHGIIPPTVGITTVNPKIKMDEWNMQIVTRPTSWPSSILRASVNSFGYGGANSHVILEAANKSRSQLEGQNEGLATPPSLRNRLYLLPISANSLSSLESRVQGLRDHLNVTNQNGPKVEVVDQPTATGLNNTESMNMKISFVFTGQGAQWPQMGKKLMENSPVFSNAVEEMDMVLKSLPHPPVWSLKQAILEPKETSKIHDVALSQPVCTAIQVALVNLLSSWGIVPSSVVGHSSGEIAASYAAGFSTAAEAITAAYYRGYVVGAYASDKGAMLAAGMSQSEAREEINALVLSDQLTVACVNSSQSVTISGDVGAINTLLETLNARNIFARKLVTGGRAYHSHHMIAVGGMYEMLLEQALCNLKSSIRLNLSNSPEWISSVTGQMMATSPTAAYWRANLESPVLFYTAAAELISGPPARFIELGPHSALELPIKQIRTAVARALEETPYAAAITRHKNEEESTLKLVGDMYLAGHLISWDKINDLTSQWGQKTGVRVLTDLPSYPWTYAAPLWIEGRMSSEFRLRKYPRHELLGSQMPGGNGLDTLWRNKLKLSDLSWLGDHKLQETVVFPAAGYISMAVEAMRQRASVLPDEPTTFEMRNVSILAALVVSSNPTADVEIFTSLRPVPVTSASMSKDWSEFSVISYEQGVSTTRAVGQVKCTRSQDPPVRNLTSPRRSGNHPGSKLSVTNFKVPCMRLQRACTSTLPLIRDLEQLGIPAEYAIHPITIDALLQTALVADAAGLTANVEAKVPVVFGSVAIRTPPRSIETSTSSSYFVHAKSELIGFGASQIDAELRDSNGQVFAQLNRVKVTPYNAGQSLVTSESERHPMMRVLWKPDLHGLGLMPEGAFTDFVNNYAAESTSDAPDIGQIKLGGALDLISHKNPAARILELSNPSIELTNTGIKLLHGPSSFPRLWSWTAGILDNEGRLCATQVDIKRGLEQPFADHPLLGDDRFDIILLPITQTADEYLKSSIPEIKSRLRERGVVLALSSLERVSDLSANGFSVIQADAGGNKRLIIAQASDNARGSKSKMESAIFVVGDNETEEALGFARQFASSLQQKTEAQVTTINLHAIEEGTIPSGSTVFSLVELLRPVLSKATNEEAARIRLITNNASRLNWVTSGNLLDGSRPDFGLAAGMSRALMMEQPSLRFMIYDIDDITIEKERTFENLAHLLSVDGDAGDYEYMQRHGVVHISRFVPDSYLNTDFRQKVGNQLLDASFCEMKPAQLSIEKPGNFDTIHYKQLSLPLGIAPDHIQVSIKTYGLNAKDYYVFGGKITTQNGTTSVEFCGIVERVGSEVSRFKPGDRVVALAPSHFGTTEIVPEWACYKLLDNESFDCMCTLPVVFATAIYSLRDRAQLQAGESVLIHAATGGVGISAIQIAQNIGAEIYATVSTEDKGRFLTETFGIPRDHIFTSRNESFVSGVLSATNGTGVDVVLNSLVGDLLHASWKCCAAFGRFVEIGKRDLLDHGRLEMEGFLQSKTYTAFDLSDMYHGSNPTVRRKFSSLISDTSEMYRQGAIAPVSPIKVFDCDEAATAFRYFSTRGRTGKVVLSFEKEELSVRVKPHKYSTVMSPEKTYILVGCLGGLGRSLSRWMVSRGARKFVFLGRSGLDNPAARALVEGLERFGADCVVVRGDVSVRADVDRAIDSVEGEIGGVVQAAMGLSEALFATMTNKSWHTAIDPKVRGTWNLHEALMKKGSDLEFFLMTSSITGSVGTATESNYCAGNYFLDLFARYRRNLGLRAASIGLGMISEVGYLHENPDIEALLLRRGIQALNEEEMLQVIDTALSSTSMLPHAYDELAMSHFLTGLEPLGFQELRKRGFEVANATISDPRAAILTAALQRQAITAPAQRDGSLPSGVAAAMEDGDDLADAILMHIMKKLGNLVLLPVEQIVATKPLMEYGMDSMIAAEFRTWFYQEFKVDIPFLELLGKTVTLKSLAGTTLADITSRRNV
ncbi:hypothetical protein S40288_08039 [Stachybotrys chartarum IBT 40288]|nr:hypothetical protein S40288_08039 [Stachybotrys chartarum IBT 40288]